MQKLRLICLSVALFCDRTAELALGEVRLRDRAIVLSTREAALRLEEAAFEDRSARLQDSTNFGEVSSREEALRLGQDALQRGLEKLRLDQGALATREAEYKVRTMRSKPRTLFPTER